MPRLSNSLLVSPAPGSSRFFKTLAFVMALSYAGVAMAEHRQQFFAEPYTGKKVESYRVELPMARAEKRGFVIPGDCDEVIRVFASGSGRWGSQIERSMWSKVDNDCRYHAFLHRFVEKPANDFVSGYDFKNANFADLPIHPVCDGASDLYNAMDCPPLPPGFQELFRFLPFPEPTLPGFDQGLMSCRIVDGVFRGRLINTPLGPRCRADRRAPGFRLMAVDYGDVNGDDFQDAILRLVPLGQGRGHAPVILPLTRMQPDGDFIIPQGVAVPTTGRRRR